MRNKQAPTLPSSAAASLALCFDVDCDSGHEVNGEVILEDCDLRDQALDQRLVKLRGAGVPFGLACAGEDTVGLKPSSDLVHAFAFEVFAVRKCRSSGGRKL